MADQKDIPHHPQHQTSSDTPVHRPEQHHRPDKGRRREQHRVQHLGHNISQRTAGLHFFLGDSAGEIIVEKRDRLPQRVAMQPRQHEVEDIGCHDDRLHIRTDAKQRRTQQQKERQSRQQQPRMVRKNGPRFCRKCCVNNPAKDQCGHDFDHASADRKHPRHTKRGTAAL